MQKRVERAALPSYMQEQVEKLEQDHAAETAEKEGARANG